MKTLFNLIACTIAMCANAQSWTPMSIGTTADVAHISFPSDDTGFATLGNGTARKTVDGGTTWTTLNLHEANSGPLQFLSSAKGFMLDDSGIVMTLNGGASWSFCLNNPNAFWMDLFFYDQSVGYASAINATYDTFYVYKTINGGASWNPCTPIQDWNADHPIIFFRTATEGYIAGSDQLHRTTDGGATWNSVYAAPGPDLIGTVTAPDATNAYCATQYSMDVAKSTNGGLTWTSTSQTLASIPYGSYFINSSTGFICGGNGFTSGYIVKTTDGGGSWTNAYTSGQTILCMDFPSNTVGYCGGTGGLIVKYNDPLSVAETNSPQLICYPNPASDFIVLENIRYGSEITITNSLGRIVYSAVANTGCAKINVSEMERGLYFISVTDESESRTISFVKN